MKVLQLRTALLLALIATADLARASSFFRFQHGGRGTAEAGAMTARSDEPSALTTNPAAVAKLDGVQIQGGLDLNSANDDYESSSGSFGAKHTIQFPPALYATWHLSDDRVPLAFGIGIDSPAWYVEDWTTAVFPGRFLTRVTEVTLFALHPVIAYEISERVSVGAGIRYLNGTFAYGDNAFVPVDSQGGPTSVEVARLADGDVDGLGLDAGFHAAGKRGGFGVVYRSQVELEGDASVRYRSFNVPPDPVLAASLGQALRGSSATLSLTLPAEASMGAWWRPIDDLLFELDVAMTQWSGLEDDADYDVDAFGGRRRQLDWDDSVSIRLATEADVTEHWIVAGGLAFEPSPVPDDNLEPGFPRGDAVVAGAGFGYQANRLRFDVGYSLHLYEDRNVRGQEADPAVSGTYASVDQVVAVSVRWRR